MLTRPRGHMHTDKHARSCVCTVCSHAYVCAHMCTYGMLVCMHMHGQVCVLTRAHSMLAHSHACTQSALTPITHRQACVFTRAQLVCLHGHVCAHVSRTDTRTPGVPSLPVQSLGCLQPRGSPGPWAWCRKPHHLGLRAQDRDHGGAVRAGGRGLGTPADSPDAQQGPWASNGNTPRPPLRSPSVSVFSAE